MMGETKIPAAAAEDASASRPRPALEVFHVVGKAGSFRVRVNDGGGRVNGLSTFSVVLDDFPSTLASAATDIFERRNRI